MVGDIVKHVTGPAAIDQPASLPARALKGRRAAGSRPGEDHVPDVQAGGGAVTDLRQRAVGKVAPLRGRAAGGQGLGQVNGVPGYADIALRVCGQVAVVVVGPAGVVAFRTVVRVRQSLDGRAGFIVARQGREVAVAVVGDALLGEAVVHRGGRPGVALGPQEASGEIIGIGEELIGGCPIGRGPLLLRAPLRHEAGLAGRGAGDGMPQRGEISG